jgi:hypothetical protein
MDWIGGRKQPASGIFVVASLGALDFRRSTRSGSLRSRKKTARRSVDRVVPEINTSFFAID